MIICPDSGIKGYGYYLLFIRHQMTIQDIGLPFSFIRQHTESTRMVEIGVKIRRR